MDIEQGKWGGQSYHIYIYVIDLEVKGGVGFIIYWIRLVMAFNGLNFARSFFSVFKKKVMPLRTGDNRTAE